MVSVIESLFVSFWLIQSFHLVLGQTEMLTAQELYDGMQQGSFQAVVDVRTASEWNRGHIENATLLESLNAFNTSSQVATPTDIAGCRNCSIAVYCQSGRRAGIAINILRANGFTGPLYNGQGTSQWNSAGFPLVQTDSIEPECQKRGECCPCDDPAPTPSPPPTTSAPAPSPTEGPGGAGGQSGSDTGPGGAGGRSDLRQPKGLVCRKDGVCDTAGGETATNCPVDCCPRGFASCSGFDSTPAPTPPAVRRRNHVRGLQRRMTSN